MGNHNLRDEAKTIRKFLRHVLKYMTLNSRMFTNHQLPCVTFRWGENNA